jgi:hypothetical protein
MCQFVERMLFVEGQQNALRIVDDVAERDRLGHFLSSLIKSFS